MNGTENEIVLQIEEENISLNLKLDERCYTCSLRGKLSDDCPNCQGKGFVLTELGQSLLKFLNRYQVEQKKEK